GELDNLVDAVGAGAGRHVGHADVDDGAGIEVATLGQATVAGGAAGRRKEIGVAARDTDALVEAEGAPVDAEGDRVGRVAAVGAEAGAFERTHAVRKALDEAHRARVVAGGGGGGRAAEPAA